MAVLMVLGGGSTVIPMLIALERFGSSTTISFLAPSCFCSKISFYIITQVCNKFILYVHAHDNIIYISQFAFQGPSGEISKWVVSHVRDTINRREQKQ